MDKKNKSTTPELLSNQIERSKDAVDLESWYPARIGIIPEFRVGKRWFSCLWLVPIVVTLLVVACMVAQELFKLDSVQDFIAFYPGQPDGPVLSAGFPIWVRLTHVFNLFMLMFIIRSGLQILADHPRLYVDNNSTPGREWFRFQKAVPRDRVWTARDDAVTLPGWLGIPGLRHSIGLARWWHFSCDALWLLNGIIFYVLLFGTHQWSRLIPTSIDVFPNALSCALQYLALHLPKENGWVRYNSLQQLAYFTTVFVAAPLAIISGIMQSPAISNRLGWIGKTFNRQVARTVHFGVLLYFIQFIVIHVTMVFITGFRRNFNHIALGTDDSSWEGTYIAGITLVIFSILWAWATPFTIKHSRIVQVVGRAIVGAIMGRLETVQPSVQYEEKDIAPYLWPNGKPPESDEFNELLSNDFSNYQLHVAGLVENPMDFSLADLKAMNKQEQITNHFCIQGWSGVAKWGGVRVSDIMALVKPTAEANFVVFHSYGPGSDGGFYYDIHSMENMRHTLSILAYEMNGEPLKVLYGAPLRLRCENELGFKLVKWIRAIEFIADFHDVGSGQGGYAEDHEFFGYRAPI